MRHPRCAAYEEKDWRRSHAYTEPPLGFRANRREQKAWNRLWGVLRERGVGSGVFRGCVRKAAS